MDIKNWRILTVLTALAMVLAACGSDGGGATDGGTPDTGDQTGTPTGDDTEGNGQAEGDPYTIGYVTDLSGPLRDSYSPTLEGFQLYIDDLNANGGIDGHPVEVVVRDDELNAERAVSAAVDLVTNRDVIGIFGLSLSSTHQPVYEAMEQEQVPVVTGFSGIGAALPPAQDYAFSAGTIFEVAGEVAGEFTQTIVPDGGTLVCVTFESVGGIAACDHHEAAARDAGFDTERVVFPVATREFASVAEEITSMNPDIVTGHYGSEQNVGVVAALRQAGYEGPYLIANYGVTEQAVRRGMQAAGSQENIFLFGRYAMIDESSPGLDELKAVGEELGTEFELSNAHVSGWGIARVAHEALAACGFPCDAEGLNTALQDLSVDMRGVTGGPVEFTEDDHYGTSYWRLAEFSPDEDAFVPVGDWLSHPSELQYGSE